MSLRTRGSTCRATQGRRQQLAAADLSAWRSTSILETTAMATNLKTRSNRAAAARAPAAPHRETRAPRPAGAPCGTIDAACRAPQRNDPA